MAYVWSWAFGPETAQELDDYTNWTPSSTTTTVIQPSNSIKHTYTGDNSDRYSIGVRSGNFISQNAMPAFGWVSFYVYFDYTNTFTTDPLFKIFGPAANKNIELEGISSTRDLKLYINTDTSFTSSVALNLAAGTWHHFGIKYDMRTTTWTAEVFIDGVSKISGSNPNNGGNLDPETSTTISFGGLRNANLPTDGTYHSDIIFYDDQNDPNPFGQFVTRIEPYLDQSATSGTWTPAANILKAPGDQAENLSGSISTSPVVSEADPTTGEFVRVLSQDLGTNLGLPSFGSFGFTSHLFASGSSATNVISKFAVGAPGPPGTFTSGAGVIDGENAYAYASSGSTIYASGSTIYLQAEISGS